MFSVVLIGTVALVVAIVGCFVIWRLDATRAEEIEHMTPPLRNRDAAGVVPAPQPKHLGG